MTTVLPAAGSFSPDAGGHRGYGRTGGGRSSRYRLPTTGDAMSTEPFADDVFDTDVPVPHRDRREHGGMPARPDDEELARRTERERVEAGLEPYDSDDVPPATDAPAPLDITETETYQGIEAVAARQEDEGEFVP